MSGIFGIIRAPGVIVTDADLAPMAETLKHRGPDGIRYFARHNAGIGQCMLHSTPEAMHEVLPFRDEASGLTLTADARIDNREELLTKLGLRPAPAEVITDSQLILHAYHKWGERCVEHLLGDFVFALWDERAQALFVARDHMGCKPFYYHYGAGLFVFASSALAVARVPAVKATLNEGRVADFLVQELEGIDKTCSWFNEISRMPPAQCGWFRDNTFRYRQYWELQPADLSHLKTDDDYLDAFTEIYTEAVRCRLRCNTEPASMLSGGLDSSTITAIARDQLVAEGRAPLRTYSAISGEARSCPETRSIEAVIAQGALRPQCITPMDTDNCKNELERGLGYLEDPFDGPWTLLSHMFLVASSDGMNVLLTGLDGEHAVGAPNNYLFYFLEDGLWQPAWTEAASFSAHFYRHSRSPGSIYFSALRARLVPEWLRQLKRWLYRPYRYRKLVGMNILRADFACGVDLRDRVRIYDLSREFPVNSSLPFWHMNIMQLPYLTCAVERYERIASYFRMECRHPLFDTRLLKFSAGLPLNYKVRGGWSKFILRLLADKWLPAEVAWREGHDQLGWLFNVRCAKTESEKAGVPREAVARCLFRYLDQSQLGAMWAEADAGDPMSLSQIWFYHRLYLWLQRSGSR